MSAVTDGWEDEPALVGHRREGVARAPERRGPPTQTGSGCGSWRGPRRHAPRARYHQWLDRHFPRSLEERGRAYDAFCARWPDLEDWFDAPLCDRAELDWAADGIGVYLTYLSLVDGIGLDYPYLLSIGRPPLGPTVRPEVFGLDMTLAGHWTTTLAALGVASGRAKAGIAWAVTVIALHRGCPDKGAVGIAELDELEAAIGARGRADVGAYLRRAARHAARRRRPDVFPRTAADKVTALRTVLVLWGWIAPRLEDLTSDADRTGRAGGLPAPEVGSDGRALRRLLTQRTPRPIADVLCRYAAAVLDDAPGGRRARGLSLMTWFLVRWLHECRPTTGTLAELGRRDLLQMAAWLRQEGVARCGEPFADLLPRAVLTELVPFLADIATWCSTQVPHRILLSESDVPELPDWPPPAIIPRRAAGTAVTGKTAATGRRTLTGFPRVHEAER